MRAGLADYNGDLLADSYAVEKIFRVRRRENNSHCSAVGGDAAADDSCLDRHIIACPRGSVDGNAALDEGGVDVVKKRRGETLGHSARNDSRSVDRNVLLKRRLHLGRFEILWNMIADWRD